MLAHPPGVLDKYFQDMRKSLAAKTHTAVYTQCHEQGLHEHIRGVIEQGVGALPIHPPKVLAGPVLALLQKMQFKSDSDKTETAGIAGFVRSIVQRNRLDVEVRRSATRGLMRFVHEHREFVQDVGSQALLQKLQKKPIGTEKNVPYTKPPTLTRAEYDQMFPEAPSDRGLFGDLLQSAVQSIGAGGSGANLVQSVVQQVQQDSGVQQKLDEYAQDVKTKVCADTERTVYEMSHAQRVQDVLRRLVERAVEKLPIEAPAALSGPVASFLQQFQPAEGSRDVSSGPKGFFQTQIRALKLDTEVKHAALRALEHYVAEHKDFILGVGVESVYQKLRDEPRINTAAAVPYVKPPPLSEAQFDAEHPEAPQAAAAIQAPKN